MDPNNIWIDQTHRIEKKRLGKKKKFLFNSRAINTLRKCINSESI